MVGERPLGGVELEQVEVDPAGREVVGRVMEGEDAVAVELRPGGGLLLSRDQTESESEPAPGVL